MFRAIVRSTGQSVGDDVRGYAEDIGRTVSQGLPLKLHDALQNSMHVSDEFSLINSSHNEPSSALVCTHASLPRGSRLPKRRNEWMVFYNIAAMEFDALSGNTAAITGTVSYRRIGNNNTEENAAQEPDTDVILFDKLTLEDRKGHK